MLSRLIFQKTRSIYIYKYMVHFWSSDNTLDDQTQKKYRTNPSLKKRFLYDPCFLPKITPLKKNIAPRAISQAHQLVKPTLRTILMDHIPPTTLERLSHWQMIFLKIYISNWIVYRNKELSIRSKTVAARPPARAH